MEPWRDDATLWETPGEGEITVNLVDMMEFLHQKPGGAAMDAEKERRAVDIFNRWKQNPAFRRRVVGILTEEGRGAARYEDLGYLVKWLRSHSPAGERYRILVHSHAGDGNTREASSLECVAEGGDGAWAAWIPQAAQGGHNSSFVFVDNLVALGNTKFVGTDMLCPFQGVQRARRLYYLDFNTYDIPGDCPTWGCRTKPLLHSAFSTTYGEEWRRRNNTYREGHGLPLDEEIPTVRESTESCRRQTADDSTV